MESSTRVAVNTGLLYGKMVITTLIALYSTRLVLNALGVTDYGIYSLVAGVIALLAFLNMAMAISTQRYMSYYQGVGEFERLKSIFNTSIVLHLVIGVLVVILIEVAGFFIFDGVLKIPPERIRVAKMVYHFMALSTFFTINAVPYDATIIAHENMLFDAVSGVLESFLKLGIALWLLVAKSDRLIIYGAATAALTIIMRIIKSSYCHWKYPECKVNISEGFKSEGFHEMVAFAGWNLFGSFCAILRNQGLAVVLNFFFGIILNAAYSIAQQVNSHLIAFATNMLKSLNPQIMKSEGSGDRPRMLRLAMLACKMAFVLLCFFAIPFIIEMPYILKIWLKTVPENAAILTQLYILLSLVQLLTYPLGTAVQSVGKIKSFQLIVGFLLLFNIPLAFLLMKLGLPPYFVLIGAIFLDVVAGAARIWIAHKVAGLSVSEYLKTVLIPCFLMMIVASLITMIPRTLIDEGFLRLGISLITSTLSLILLAKFLVLSDDENQKIADIIHTFYTKTKGTISIFNSPEK